MHPCTGTPGSRNAALKFVSLRLRFSAGPLLCICVRMFVCVQRSGSSPLGTLFLAGAVLSRDIACGEFDPVGALAARSFGLVATRSSARLYELRAHEPREKQA